MADDVKRTELFGDAPVASQNANKASFDYEVPVDSVPLPSKGRVYSTDCSLYGRDTVDIRAMTAREEDILTSRALIKQGTVITHLLKSCLVDKTIDVDGLIAGDRNAIMISLRVTGYGSDYGVEIDCPQCGEKSKQTFDLTQLSVRNLDIAPITEGSNLFEFLLPVSKKRVTFKFLTGNDERDITVASEKAKKQGQLSDNLVSSRLSYSIVTVDGVSDRAKVLQFVRNMPARDSLEIRRHIDRSEPGVDMTVDMTCPTCCETSKTRLPIGVSFFWPE